MAMLVKDAVAIVKIGTGNSKMPGTTFSSDAFACKVGSRLAKLENSVCKSCYARRIQKLRPSVNQGWTANYEKSVAMIAHKPEIWVNACIFQIKRQSEKTGIMFHRWFDSGDLDSLDQLKAIVSVAKQTPKIAHWLPTREVKTVEQYKRKFGSFPGNLVVRVSAPMIDQKPLKGHKNTSTVASSHENIQGNECKAYRTTIDNETLSLTEFKKYEANRRKDSKNTPKIDLGHCGNCRACWNIDCDNVTYIKH